MSNFIVINGRKIYVTDWSITLLQLCDSLGYTIPRFCYHERLSIAGNCRMCMVELSNSIKPVIACATSLTPGMNVSTDSILVKKARENVLEFLLINHPLDCPICDQGGECDLQDITMIYGSDSGRFREIKRSVEDKDFGPLIKTVMTRCIHCTRCVRFFDEIAGSSILGTMGRGRDTEISTYIKSNIYSEISGNVIDLCPVGALTSKPYAFTARPWELSHTESIDIFDGFGSNIRIDVRGSEIMRILPKANDFLNQEWITDKIRFCYDGLKIQRLTTPFYKNNVSGLIPCSWDYAFSLLSNCFYNVSNSIDFYMGEMLDIHTLTMLKLLTDNISLSSNFIIDNYHNNIDFRNMLYSNNDINENHICMFLFLNMRTECTILNVKLRNINSLNLFIGNNNDYNYNVLHLGFSYNTLLNVLKGKSFICNRLNGTTKLHLFTGDYTSNLNYNLNSFISSFNMLLPNSNLNYIYSNSSNINLFELGYLNNSNINNTNNNNNSNILYLLNYNNTIKDIENKYVIYQGHHGDTNAYLSNLILPINSFMEDHLPFINVYGQVQWTYPATLPMGLAISNYSVFYKLLSLNNIIVNDYSKSFLCPKLVTNYNFTSPFSFNSSFNKHYVYNSNSRNFYNLYNYYTQNTILRHSRVIREIINQFDI
jgi:NADH-quinone oxidoreductase chain G